MAFGDVLIHERLLAKSIQIEEANGVRDGRLGSADPASHVLVGQAEIRDEGAIRRRGFDRAEVGALKVLDEGDFELISIRKLADHRRNALQTRESGRPEAAL